MKKLLTLMPIVAIALTACGQKDYTSDYLFEHDDVRKQVIEDCKANKQSDSNCKNAAEAEARKFNSTGGKKVQQWQ